MAVYRAAERVTHRRLLALQVSPNQNPKVLGCTNPDGTSWRVATGVFSMKARAHFR
jgi:hypothetical protein